ncbi:ABC transporter type 1, transmembrane domain-containing protein [Phascolomyces articulosus]|uniref:Mitochondrial potassium channel ATP-binding subunit n=1 Tax=Phascolomyces articulosus TaxID=60185 RepID=A0AAD5JMC0_9FUNG|nr:ABC transporter type 1, transmembrane domain-containing protein [Phascolomyces articulosus]
MPITLARLASCRILSTSSKNGILHCISPTKAASLLFRRDLSNSSIAEWSQPFSSKVSNTKVISFSSSQHLFLRPTVSLCLIASGYKLVTTHPTMILKTCYCEASPFHQEPISLKMPPTVKQITEQYQQPQQKQVSLIRDIWSLIKPDLLLMCCIVLTAVAAAFIQLQTPVITGELINVISSGSSALLASAGISQLNRPAMKLFGLLSAQGILTFAHISLVSIFGENVAKRLRAQLFAAMVKQDMSFFDTHRSGELVGRLTTDVADFKHTFKQLVTQGLKSVTQTVGSAIHLFKISTPLTLTMLGTMPVLYVLLNIYGAYLRKLSRHGKSIEGQATGVAGEAISNMRTVRAFAAEEKEMEYYGQACDELSTTSRKLGFHIGMFQGLTNISIGCMVLTVLYYGGSLVVRNELTGGELMSYMLSTQTAQQSLVSLGVLFGQTIKAAASATRVFEFIHLEPTVPIKGGNTLSNVWGDVRFQDIEFSYPSRPDHQVLDLFNLHVHQGTTVALCGSSGSGKSTIASLLERFYEPTAGSVFLDGNDLSDMDPSWLRQQIGFINQEPVLFATTILENIRYGRPDATMEQVQQAARQANAEAFIESFPDGYDTVVGERGAALSGGQKQRIAIARAILKDPKVIMRKKENKRRGMNILHHRGGDL